jgi:murein DD-endopeptidase MepM/ murein hydrolase activator NlpD
VVREEPLKVPVTLSPPLRRFDRNRITSRFGVRTDTRYNTREFHSGIDIKAKRGERVIAAAPGTIVFAGKQRGYGRVVIIDHGQRFFTVYAHLASLETRKGARVERGEMIGTVGTSGRTTGVHLHFEVRSGGKAVDPLRYL